MDLIPVTWWAYIGIFSTVLAGVFLALLLWRRRELRRYEAMEVADQMTEWGLKRIASLLRAYAVGNYLGRDSVTRITHQLVSDIQGEGLPAMLRSVGWKMVEGVFVKDEDDRTKLFKLLEAAAPDEFGEEETDE